MQLEGLDSTFIWFILSVSRLQLFNGLVLLEGLGVSGVESEGSGFMFLR